MATTGLSSFERAVEDADVWINGLLRHVAGKDRAFAFHVLRATFHALRDHVGPDDASRFAGHLPILLRGLFYEGWQLSVASPAERERIPFLVDVRRRSPRLSEREAEQAVHAVFEVAWEQMDAGALARIIRNLPPGVRDHWPRIAHRG